MATDLTRNNNVRDILLTACEGETGPLAGKNLISIYMLLIVMRNYKTNTTHISYDTIKNRLGIRRNDIKPALEKLKELGLIKYYEGSYKDAKANLYSFPLEDFGGKTSKLPPRGTDGEGMTEVKRRKAEEKAKREGYYEETIPKAKPKPAIKPEVAKPKKLYPDSNEAYLARIFGNQQAQFQAPKPAPPKPPEPEPTPVIRFDPDKAKELGYAEDEKKAFLVHEALDVMHTINYHHDFSAMTDLLTLRDDLLPFIIDAEDDVKSEFLNDITSKDIYKATMCKDIARKYSDFNVETIHDMGFKWLEKQYLRDMWDHKTGKTLAQYKENTRLHEIKERFKVNPPKPDPTHPEIPDSKSSNTEPPKPEPPQKPVIKFDPEKAKECGYGDDEVKAFLVHEALEILGKLSRGKPKDAILRLAELKNEELPFLLEAGDAHESFLNDITYGDLIKALDCDDMFTLFRSYLLDPKYSASNFDWIKDDYLERITAGNGKYKTFYKENTRIHEIRQMLEKEHPFVSAS